MPETSRRCFSPLSTCRLAMLWVTRHLFVVRPGPSWPPPNRCLLQGSLTSWLAPRDTGLFDRLATSFPARVAFQTHSLGALRGRVRHAKVFTYCYFGA
jgi:hypothetical protein